MKSRANQAVANRFIKLDWSFFITAKMMMAPNAGSQVMNDRM